MRIYVSAIVQHSIFSSGHHTTVLQIAAALKDLGHDVCFVNVMGNKATWWDDLREVAEEYPVFQKDEFHGPSASVDCIGGVIKGDLLIDCIGSLSGPERAAIAARTVLFVRYPPLHHEIESIVYPATSLRRSYDGLSEIWSWDFYTPNDFTMLALLGRCPVRSVPFVWSPRFLDKYVATTGIVPWSTTANQGAGWICRIAETNNTNRSNCTIPLITLTEFTKRCPDRVAGTFVHNGIELSQRQFFKENVLKHCAMKPEPIFVGRNRVVEWCMQPRSFLLAHCRFTPIRYLYLDAAYMGIPMIHNSPFLRQLGGQFERYYYANNQVVDASKAIERLMNDYAAGWNDELARTRAILSQAFTVKRSDGWSAALTAAVAASVAPTLPPATYQGVVSFKAPEVPAKPTFRVQFVGMWDQFQVSYNFFTLLLEAYFNGAATVVGCDHTYDGDDIALRILGPFVNGAVSVRGGVPTVFTTSENMPPLPAEVREKNNIKVELGFSVERDGKDGYMRLPLWMMSIDWFGADNDRLVNPRLIPLEWLVEGARGAHSSADSIGQGVRGSAGPPSKFCCFVVTNPNNPVRNAALDLIGQVGHVDSAGRYRNNCGDAIFAGLGGGGGEVKKVEFMRNYRFAITYENGLGDGYVTEKMFHAKAAGCVPIYWGDAVAAAADFVPGGWITANGRSDEELIAEVRRIEGDEAAYKALATKPLLDEGRVYSVRRRLANVAAAMVAAAKTDICVPKPEVLGRDILGRGIKAAEKQTIRDGSKPYGRAY